MRDSENENLCPEPARAALIGGCPGKTHPVPPRDFSCENMDCPWMARIALFYGDKTMSDLGARMSYGAGEVILFPANDNI